MTRQVFLDRVEDLERSTLVLQREQLIYGRYMTITCYIYIYIYISMFFFNWSTHVHNKSLTSNVIFSATRKSCKKNLVSGSISWRRSFDFRAFQDSIIRCGIRFLVPKAVTDHKPENIFISNFNFWDF